MKTIIALALAALLAGCGTTKATFENRIACTVDGAELHVLSKWGPVSIGSRVADPDAAAVCRPAIPN